MCCSLMPQPPPPAPTPRCPCHALQARKAKRARGLLGMLSKLALAPVVWAIVLGMLTVLVVAVVQVWCAGKGGWGCWGHMCVAAMIPCRSKAAASTRPCQATFTRAACSDDCPFTSPHALPCRTPTSLPLALAAWQPPGSHLPSPSWASTSSTEQQPPTRDSSQRTQVRVGGGSLEASCCVGGVAPLRPHAAWGVAHAAPSKRLPRQVTQQPCFLLTLTGYSPSRSPP
jgi:hypothetical protein